MEQTKQIASHISLVDLSETKELGVQHLDQKNLGQGQELCIEAYHWVSRDDDVFMDILNAANDDDRPKFVAGMKRLFESPFQEGVTFPEKEAIEAAIVKFCPGYVLCTVLSSNAVDCATALLEGETETIVFINTPFYYGQYPLHVLAENLSYEMIYLFLELGARTNVRTISKSMYPFYGGPLPLNSSLDALSYQVRRLGWTPEQSIFKLIFVLCLPAMKQPLEVNRLLACNTEEVEDILIHYAIEGERVQMAALLIVAWEKVMPPSLLHNTGGSSLGGINRIRQFVLEEIKKLADKEAKLMCENNYSEFGHKSAGMMSALVLLAVFERAGDHIATFMHGVHSQSLPKERVVGFIKLLLGQAGVVFEGEDVDLSDIDCGSPTIEGETEIIEKQTTSMSELQDRCVPLHSMSGKPCLEKLTTNSALVRKSSKWTFSPSVFVRGTQSYHTFRYLEDEFVPVFPSPMQIRVKRTMGVKEPFPHVMSSKKFLSIALAIKRRTMQI